VLHAARGLLELVFGKLGQRACRNVYADVERMVIRDGSLRRADGSDLSKVTDASNVSGTTVQQRPRD
jgi:hypothetical protein